MSSNRAGAARSVTCILLAVLACAVASCESKGGGGRSKPAATKADTAKPAATKAAPKPAATATEAAKPTAADACQEVCSQAKKLGHIACVEGQLEELGFEMDADACDEWENVVAMGGDSCAQFTKCQAAEKFTAEHCRKVKAACFK